MLDTWLGEQKALGLGHLREREDPAEAEKYERVVK